MRARMKTEVVSTDTCWYIIFEGFFWSKSLCLCIWFGFQSAVRMKWKERRETLHTMCQWHPLNRPSLLKCKLKNYIFIAIALDDM